MISQLSKILRVAIAGAFAGVTMISVAQAEKITYISHEGRMQLALRSPGDHDVVKTKSTGVSDLLPPRYPKRGKGTLVQVIRGSEQSRRRF